MTYAIGNRVMAASDILNPDTEAVRWPSGSKGRICNLLPGARGGTIEWDEPALDGSGGEWPRLHVVFHFETDVQVVDDTVMELADYALTDTQIAIRDSGWIDIENELDLKALRLGMVRICRVPNGTIVRWRNEYRATELEDEFIIREVSSPVTGPDEGVMTKSLRHKHQTYEVSPHKRVQVYRTGKGFPVPYGFWTAHDIEEDKNSVDEPPGECALLQLKAGMMHIPGTDQPYILVLRETFDSFEEGKVWMDDVFHQTDWDEYLKNWKDGVRAGGRR